MRTHSNRVFYEQLKYSTHFFIQGDSCDVDHRSLIKEDSYDFDLGDSYDVGDSCDLVHIQTDVMQNRDRQL